MELKCELTAIDYVCGTDGVTHANECYLNMTACISRKKIGIAHRGVCLPDEEVNNQGKSSHPIRP